MEKIIWTDRVKNKKVLQRVKDETNVLCIIRRRPAKWISGIWRRNCVLKHVIAGKIKVKVG